MRQKHMYTASARYVANLRHAATVVDIGSVHSTVNVVIRELASKSEILIVGKKTNALQILIRFLEKHVC